VLNKLWHRELDFWSSSAFVLGLILLLPLITVLVGLADVGPKWDHVKSTVLASYVFNTFILAVAVTFLATLFAVPAAWFVSAYEFPGRRIFVWTLVLPLAIPTYVAAFVYYQFTEAAIPLLIHIRSSWGIAAFQISELFLRFGLLVLLMASVLYPYIYLSARASFSQQRKRLIEAAQSLGHGPWSVFFTVALPLARPVLVAGASLVVMEVINDYGAVHFFGVPTLTEGIFRTWFALGDRASALRLAGFIMLAVFLVLLLEQNLRGRARYADPSSRLSVSPLQRLRGIHAFLATSICFIPLSLGLLFPTGQLLIWASKNWAKVFKADFAGHLINSMLLALVTAGVLTSLALLLSYAAKLHPVKWLRTVNGLASLGYAAPGAVVAVGVMTTVGSFDRFINSLLDPTQFPVFVLSGTILVIGFAYCVRFLAVSLQPVRGGLSRICGTLDEASFSLGRGPGETLWRINIPLLSGTLLVAFMLVFIDILKELPLTMILRPANFETMATAAFSLAKEGRIYECAVPSIILLFAGGFGLIAIKRFLLPEQ
tara:strand:+ start:4845 stop:6473 length:1629 start_codon:yes stop_codon:yes gene_type:complete